MDKLPGSVIRQAEPLLAALSRAKENINGGAMSDQDEDAERELDNALDSILGPSPKGSATDVLRPIERENVRRYIEMQMRTYAAAGQAARVQGIQRELE